MTGSRVQELYRLDKQYSQISAIASLYYLFDTIGIYHCKIFKILAYYINHIGITTKRKNQLMLFMLHGGNK
jgi:hypothetical protein